MKQLLGVAVGAVLSMACGQGPGEPEGDEVAASQSVASESALRVTASYDSLLKVPRCVALGSGCDSGTLLDGRGALGPELNAPNTLGGTCADGNSGTYHRDESVDRMQIHTLDGGPLAPGKTVSIVTTVYAWSTNGADRLDLFYAADATHPSWTHITTLVPTVVGTQSLVTNYTLPSSGGTVQAIRASFHYLGYPTPCSPDAYDDRDDLAFSVAGANVSRLAGGGSASLAIQPNGDVALWGYDSNNFVTRPTRVPRLENTRSLVASYTHALAIKFDGSLWASGINEDGQLGNGTTTSRGRNDPILVPGLTAVVAAAASQRHSLALRSDGTVWAWGANDYGQLGNGTTTRQLTPVQVSGLTDVVAVAAAYTHSVALKADGTVWAWGGNGQAQLGNGTYTSSLTPVKVSGVSTGVAISASWYHSMVLKQDGTAWRWGGNFYPNGSTTGASSYTWSTPVRIEGLTEVRSLVTGDYFSLATKSDGTLWTWGTNSSGQLGDGTTTRRETPGVVPGLTEVVGASMGSAHALAFRGDGSLWSWGENFFGQLGDGTETNRSTPVKVY